MGKNANRPVRHTGGSGGAGGDSYEEQYAKREFHSEEYKKRELELLLAQPERVSWEEFKKQQDQKKMEEEAEFYGHGMDMASYRKQLDEERDEKLRKRAAERERQQQDADKSKKKEKKRKGKDKDRKKKKKRQRDGSGSSTDSDEADPKGAKKKKQPKSAPVKLSEFFQTAADDPDAL